MENKCRKVDLNMCGYVQSLTDPIEEHKETMSLDLDFEHLQRVCLGKSYFYYKLMSKPLRMAVKTQPFDNEIFETSFIVKHHPFLVCFFQNSIETWRQENVSANNSALKSCAGSGAVSLNTS